MKKTHNDIAEFYDKQYHSNLEYPDSPSRHHKNLAEKLNVQKADSVLDIACGKGDWLQACAEIGASVCGIDISENAINTCRERIPGGEFLCQPAETLPYSDNSFDVITCLGSLEHFLDQENAIREMFRVARPNARILILVPNSDFLTYRLGLYRGTNQQAVHETLRSLDEWRKMITNNGLTIESRWKDLHILNRAWILRHPYPLVPVRLTQALLLLIWPLKWQYQVYHLCHPAKNL